VLDDTDIENELRTGSIPTIRGILSFEKIFQLKKIQDITRDSFKSKKGNKKN